VYHNSGKILGNMMDI